MKKTSGMGRERQIAGQQGEERAVSYLTEVLGYSLLSRNFRTRDGEIDIILMDGETLVFVEVRTTREKVFGPDSINFKKKQKMCKVALKYLENLKRDYKRMRFDAVFVEREPAAGLEHVENIIMLA